MRLKQARRWFQAAMASVALFSSSLAAGTPLASPADPAALNKLASAHNRFGFQLLRQLGGTQAGDQNLFISPASVAWALAMVLNGASGGTYQAVAQTLQLGDLSVDRLNQANAALKASLEGADSKAEISIANSLWGGAAVHFLPAFLAAAKEYYAASLETLQSAAQVNAWVGEKTRGKIASIFTDSDVRPDTVLILVNALYFKGLWSRPFDKALTQEREFHSAAGTRRKLPMMSQSGSYHYAESPAFQAIQLPYGDGRLRLSLVLPAKTSSLAAFLRGLDVNFWETLRGKMEDRPGKIVLPKFKVEYGEELLPALSALGMGQAFSGGADFSKIAAMPAGQRLYISGVRHKTFVELNEEGTEAAAVTSVGIRATSMPIAPKPPFEILVDRPFFITIEDWQTGLVLFMGSVADPG